jgi:hypothetical protein
VRDSYAQLAAEVMRLRQRVAELEAEKAAPPVPAPIVATKPVTPRPPPPPAATEQKQKPVEAKKPPVVSTPPAAEPAPKLKATRLPPPPPSAPRARNTRRGK